MPSGAEIADGAGDVALARDLLELCVKPDCQFVDLSHAVGHCPHATAADLTGRIVATRQPFPHCGPKKIRAWLSNRAPGETWPAASTIADILKREGLVEPRRRQRRPLAQGEIVAPAVAANECQWAIDFKGHFRTASGVRCDPLTVTDQASRYLLEVRIIEPTTVGVKRALERVFGAAGLPDAIHSDKRRTVRFDRRRRSVVTVGVVAEARHRAALHSAGEPAGQRPA